MTSTVRRQRPARLAVVALAALAACTSGSSEDPAAVASGGSAPVDGLRGRVVRVVDGDTVDVNLDGGETERVRLLGIDTPETVKPDSPVECFGPEASARTHDLLAEGTEVVAKRDIEARDRFGRLLLYLWRAEDGVFVNEALVEEGFARTLSIDPNVAYRALLAQREREARQRDTGLWVGVRPRVTRGSVALDDRALPTPGVRRRQPPGDHQRR